MRRGAFWQHPKSGSRLLPVWWAALVLGIGAHLLACTTVDVVANNCESNGLPCPEPGSGDGGGSQLERFDDLDLLLVVDNGPNMAATQRALVPHVAEMLRVLLSGDINSDQTLEMRPVSSVNVAVISGDLGAPGVSGWPDCGDDTLRPAGDDGRFLLARPNVTVDGMECNVIDVLEPFITLRASRGPEELEQNLRRVVCRAAVGTGGCRFAMPLDAGLKALWNDTLSPLSFAGSNTVHGGTLHAGFLRPSALLAVIVVTRRDDCSSSDLTHLQPADALSPDDPLASIAPALRCALSPDHLQPLARFENNYAMPKMGLKRRVFFGFIGGVPSEVALSLTRLTSDDGREMEYRAALDHPRMQYAIDANAPHDARHLVPACEDAEPARRLLELARRVGRQGAVGSICDNLAIPVDTMMRSIARLMDPQTTL